MKTLPIFTLARFIRFGFLCLLPIGGLTGDWLQFRGEHSTGINEAVSLDPERSLESQVAWMAELPGRGLSSPLVFREKVLVTCATGKDQNQLEIWCLNSKTGSPLWHRAFWATGRTMCHEKTSVAASTPAADGHAIVALFSSNDLFCLDLSGNVKWIRALMLDYPNASNSLGMASSPVIVGDVVVVQIENDSQSMALGIEMETGMNRWVLQRPRSANWTSPTTLGHPVTGNTMVALQSSSGITVVEPETGAIVAEYREGAATIPSSVAHENILYAPSNGITALKLEPGQSEMKQLWRSARLRPDTASPIVIQGRLYAINSAGVLNCAGLEDGERLWQSRMEGPFSASPVGWKHWLLAVNEAGLLQLVDLARGEGRVTQRLHLEETILSTPALGDGGLFIRSDRHIWRIGN